MIDSALASVGFDEKKTLPFEQIIGSKPSLLITLYFKAKNSLQLFLKNGCEEDLERAHEDYDLCIRLIDYIISSFDDSDSKQYLVGRFYYIFESIIEVNYQFYQLRGDRKYVNRAMRYMEKSRSILLKEMMQQSKANILAGIPDTLLSTERRLREQIATLENRRYESSRKLPAAQQNDPAFHAHNDSLFILREQYWALLKQMEQDYPAYYTMKHADRSPETAAILNRLLQPQEALVQYFVGDDHIYTLVYRGDGGYFMTKAPIGALDDDIKALRESIYNYVLTPSDTLVKAYADGAYRLYQKLLQPISAHLPYRVTIIPDGLLEYLPFEALLTEKADPNSSFRAWPYCLRKYSFCYAHSVLSLEEMRQRQNRPKYRQVLAIAPSF
ncbi:MAG: CHAT domain-containing protein, partial [Saprospiraceae bacterium]